MKSWMLAVILSDGLPTYESCMAQAVHEQVFLDRAPHNELIAVCMLEAPYAPPETLRPVARPER